MKVPPAACGNAMGNAWESKLVLHDDGRGGIGERFFSLVSPVAENRKIFIVKLLILILQSMLMCIEHVNVNVYRVRLLIDIHRLYCCLIEILFIMKGCLAATGKVFQP